ncbi:MAG: hypothetical protein FH761_07485 [Firmicutes bacterium]|nr:hypothetical protein [Bacillota bacterium]
MREKILFLLVLMFILSGCSKAQESRKEKVNTPREQNKLSDQTNSAAVEKNSNSLSNSEIIINEQSFEDKGMFYLGMTLEDLYSLDLYNTDYQITSTIIIEENKNSWDYGHTVIWTQNFSLLFDTNEILYRITVNGDLETILGLKVSDSKKVLKKLYGKNKSRYNFDWGYVLEYNMKNNYFFVSIQDNKITQWGISKYKYDYRGN